MLGPESIECCDNDALDPSPMTDETIAAVAKALGHPARVHILEQFEAGVPHMVQEIVGECELAQSTVSEHLRILREAGVVCSHKDGPRTWYCIRRSALMRFVGAVDRIVADTAPLS